MARQIYFAECEGKIKVGIAKNVKSRLSQLRTGSAAPLTLIASVAGSLPIERALHKKLRPFHISGEWYRDCPEIRAAIQNSLNNFPAGAAAEAIRKQTSSKFKAVANILWPVKTAAHIAAIAGVDERSAARWLSGYCEPPAVVIAAIVVEITRRT